MPMFARPAVLLLILTMSMTSACMDRGLQGHRVHQQAQHQRVDSTRADENAEQAGIVLINNSADQITAVYVSASGGTQHGPNLLDGEVLPVGGVAHIGDVPAGSWDISVRDASGYSRTYRGQVLDGKHRYSLIVDAYHWQ